MTTNSRWKEVKYPNRHGLLLAGLLLTKPSAETAVVVCHGFTGSKEGGGKAVEMAEQLELLGYATLLFDFSGCGDSEGDFADISLTRHIADISSSVDFCLRLGFYRIVTVGRSFGGTAALCHAASDPRVSGISCWAAPSDPAGLFSGFLNGRQGTVDNLVPLSGERGTVYVKNDFFTDLKQYDVTKSASSISPRPLLVLHGSNDSVVQPENARAIYKEAGVPKELCIINGSDHQFSGHYQLAWEAVFKWLAEHFPNH